MERLLVATIAVTSLAACLVGFRALRLDPGALPLACRRALETVGLALLFFLVDLAAAATIVLLLRFATRRFVSLYLLDDAAWMLVPLLQALIFDWWRQLSRPSSSPVEPLESGSGGPRA